jgi:hypothetical protein
MTQQNAPRSEFGDFLLESIKNITQVYAYGVAAGKQLPSLSLNADDAQPTGNNPIDRAILDSSEAVDAVSDPQEERFQRAVSDARSAFWKELHRQYPEIPEGATLEDREIEARFEISTEGAADAWLAANGVQVLVVAESPFPQAIGQSIAKNPNNAPDGGLAITAESKWASASTRNSGGASIAVTKPNCAPDKSISFDSPAACTTTDVSPDGTETVPTKLVLDDLSGKKNTNSTLEEWVSQLLKSNTASSSEEIMFMIVARYSNLEAARRLAKEFGWNISESPFPQKQLVENPGEDENGGAM